MDNVTPVPSTDSPCVIDLDPLQYAFYQQNALKLRSPDGKHLETVGTELQQEHNREIASQLLDQICFVQSLTSHVDQHLELPPRAVCGLSDLLYRMEMFCESHIK